MKKWWISLSITLAACFTAGCSTETRETFSSSVHIQRMDNSSLWNVTYDFSKPIDGVMFVRQRNQFRSGNWVSLTPGVQVIRSAHGELITSSSGQFQSVTLAIRPYFDETPKDYEFFVPFSDGGMLLYTGHFNIYPVQCTGGCYFSAPQPLAIDLKTEFRFTGRPSDKITVDGASLLKETPGMDLGLGKFVYFGKDEAKEAGGFRAILDPRLPPWVVEEIRRVGPSLINYYSTKTGFSLASTPLMFFSFDKNAQQTYGRGGVLPSQVQLTLGGDDWNSRSLNYVERFHSLLAHEIAHFWNGDLFMGGGEEGDSWMHEGGSEAFAVRAMRDLHLIDQDRFWKIHDESLNQCSQGLTGIALNESDRIRRYRNYYDCGLMIGLFTEFSVRHRYNDLFGFWSDLFREAYINNRRYTTQMYFDQLDRTGDRNLNLKIRELAQQRLPNPSAFLRETYNYVGVPPPTGFR